MHVETRLKVMERMYVHTLVDSIRHYGQLGVLDSIIEEKKKVQLSMGKKQAEQFGITQPENVFTVLSDIFNCTSWEIKRIHHGFQAKAKKCTLCAYAKKAGVESPCYMYCLNPMEGMVKGIDPQLDFKVEKTLWSDDACVVSVTK
ncbi:L-2-amino-thiazoline-4-carboxylic acid hydrolase [Vallitalea pronyensis]|uniref:L-2-amino-thiazoline-4-carboxylic acid hydrolase n=1 Tax=Vallitalea pronyensis TaxID=1348613 RepID=A0A8J8SFJ6_9FIRM|nr:L-2-amino-thiazoline-4-carboxylic acid hydrolase [Vallitalea pronyensis]QUI21417.1 L-2-amino-thiazoline-4-carboxylic acid hydrolase [Vallitalea pronyensis]